MCDNLKKRGIYLSVWHIKGPIVPLIIFQSEKLHCSTFGKMRVIKFFHDLLLTFTNNDNV